MKGIILISHGDLAKGMAHSATFFMGDSIEQLEYCCLQQDNAPEDYAKELKKAIEKTDSGDGVVILADLFGGTPCNQAIRQLSNQVDLIAGMNFPILLELLTARMEGEISIQLLAENGRSGISDVKELVALQTYDERDE